MINVCNLYPQYQIIPDRRTKTAHVPNDRRSGMDRRSVDRVKLDTNLTRDIFVLKNSVSAANKNNNVASENVNNITFTKKLQKALESIGNKEQNDSFTSNIKKKDYIQEINKSDEPSSVGMVAGSLGTALGLNILGPNGLFAGICSLAYFCAKSVTNLIKSLS